MSRLSVYKFLRELQMKIYLLYSNIMPSGGLSRLAGLLRFAQSLFCAIQLIANHARRCPPWWRINREGRGQTFCPGLPGSCEAHFSKAQRSVYKKYKYRKIMRKEIFNCESENYFAKIVIFLRWISVPENNASNAS